MEFICRLSVSFDPPPHLHSESLTPFLTCLFCQNHKTTGHRLELAKYADCSKNTLRMAVEFAKHTCRVLIHDIHRRCLRHIVTWLPLGRLSAAKSIDAKRINRTIWRARGKEHNLATISRNSKFSPKRTLFFCVMTFLLRYNTILGMSGPIRWYVCSTAETLRNSAATLRDFVLKPCACKS